MKPERVAWWREQLEANAARRADPWRPGPYGDEPEPASEHVDPGAYAGDLARIFDRAWLPVARDSELAEPGAWKRIDVGDRRLVATRAADGEPRVLHNVCPHRGSLLVEAPCGKSEVLRCPYHGLGFGLDGVLKSAPAALGFGPTLEVGRTTLRPARVGRWGGWWWTCLDPEAPPLEAFLGEPLIDTLAGYGPEAVVPWVTETFEVDLGWRLVVEAFLEPLHVPLLHPRTVQPFIDFGRGAMTALGHHSVMAAPWRLPDLYEPSGPIGKAAAAVGVAPFPDLDPVQRTHNLTVLVFPGVTVNLMPNHFTTTTAWPVGPQRTRIEHAVLGRPVEGETALAWTRNLARGHADVLREDFAALRRVAEGLRAGHAADRLSSYELRVRHFRRTVRAWREAGP